MDDIIDDYIVDITNCLQKHRGGASILEENAGTDAILLFEKVCHSNEAYGVFVSLVFTCLNHWFKHLPCP